MYRNDLLTIYVILINITKSTKQSMVIVNVFSTSAPVEKLMVICITLATTAHVEINRKQFNILFIITNHHANLPWIASVLVVKLVATDEWQKIIVLLLFTIISLTSTWSRRETIWIWRHCREQMIINWTIWHENSLEKLEERREKQSYCMNFVGAWCVSILTLANSSRTELVMFSERRSKHIETHIAMKASSIRPKPFSANARR